MSDQRAASDASRGALRDQRGAVFAEYTIVFGTTVLVFMLAFGAFAATMQMSYWNRIVFLHIDAIQ